MSKVGTRDFERKLFDRIGRREYERRIESMRYRLRATDIRDPKTLKRLRMRLKAAEWVSIEVRVQAAKAAIVERKDETA